MPTHVSKEQLNQYKERAFGNFQQLDPKGPRLFPDNISPTRETRVDGDPRGAFHSPPWESPLTLTLPQAGEISFFKPTTISMSSGHGFLPKNNPVTEIEGDESFNTFLELGSTLPKLVSSETVRERLDTMELPFFPKEQYPYPALVRAYAVAVSLVHAYIHESGKASGDKAAPVVLPERLSSWIEALSHQIGRLPTQTYETYVLQNYFLKDQEKGYELDNIEPLVTYTGSDGEKWFIKMHVYAEAFMTEAMKDAEAIHQLLLTNNSSSPKIQGQLIGHLEQIGARLSHLNAYYFDQMKEGLSPEYFFGTLRVFLKNWKGGVMYEDSAVYTEQAIHWRGASGAGSSFIPYLDLSLQIKIKQETSMLDFRNYMPPEHQGSLDDLLINSLKFDLSSYIKSTENTQLINAYNSAVEGVHGFRNGHYKSFIEPYLLDCLIKSHVPGILKAITISAEENNTFSKDENERSEMIYSLLSDLFKSYKELTIDHKMEHLSEANQSEYLNTMINQLKQSLLKNNSDFTSQIDETYHFRVALITKFRSIIEIFNTNPLFSSLTLEKIFDCFVILSNKTLGTGGEDFSIFLKKNIKNTKESELKFTFLNNGKENIAEASSTENRSTPNGAEGSAHEPKKNPLSSPLITRGLFSVNSSRSKGSHHPQESINLRGAAEESIALPGNQ